MPYKTWTASDAEEFTDDRSIVQDGKLRLIKRSSSGMWTPSSPYTEYSEVIFSNLRAKAITELFGFSACFEENEGVVGFQLSPDEGATFYRYDGANWVNDGDFSTWEEIDCGIPDFPVDKEDITIQIKVRLERSPDTFKTPILKSMTLFYELHYHFWEDFLRSVKRALENNLYVRFMQVCDFTSPALSVELDLQTGLAGEGAIATPINIYNLTADPGRTTNLYASHTGSTVTMSSPQVGAIEITYCYQPAIFISSDDYFFETTRNPVVVLVTGRLTEDFSVVAYSTEYDIRFCEKKARARWAPTLDRISLIIICQDYHKQRVLALSDGIDKVLSKGYIVFSEATGNPYTVVETPEKSTVDFSRENFKTIESFFQFSGMRWIENKPGEYQEVDLAETIKLRVTTDEKSEEFDIPET